MTDTGPVVDWLLDPEHSDPSIRWQVMRDVLNAPPSAGPPAIAAIHRW
jgi:hypothetical protein